MLKIKTIQIIQEIQMAEKPESDTDKRCHYPGRERRAGKRGHRAGESSVQRRAGKERRSSGKSAGGNSGGKPDR